MNKTEISNHLRSFNTAEHKCVICGANFTAYKQAKYCSNACQQKAKYARMKAKKATPKLSLNDLFKEYDFNQIKELLGFLNLEVYSAKSGVLGVKIKEQDIYFYCSDTPAQNKQNLINLFKIYLNE